MSYESMIVGGLIERMFDMDRHTQWLYKKQSEATSEADREEIDREIRDWWYEWKEYQS